jgi:hypothetical protein
MNCQQFWQVIVGNPLESLAEVSATLTPYNRCRISELLTFVSENGLRP